MKERLTSIEPLGVDLRAGMAGATPDSPPEYAMICNLSFGTIEELSNALATHGSELTGDIKNFTNVQPIMQISQSV